MFVICRSPKGGVGTSVVAAALALRHAHAGHPTVLVDLAGDQPDLLGVAPSSSLGIGDWAAEGDDVPVEAGRLRWLRSRNPLGNRAPAPASAM